MNASQWMFILYIIIALYAGWRSRTRNRTEFWTASRQLDGLSVGLSISAGFMSVSWSCVYTTQLFYWYGMGAIWLVTIPWLLTLIVIFVLSRRFHMMEGFSQPELAAQRYGPYGRLLVALALMFVFLVWGGAELYIAAKLLAPSLNLSVSLLIVIIGLVILLYSISGGFRAVILTDKIQYILVALYIATIGFLAWKGYQQAPVHHIESLLVPKSHTPFMSLFSPGWALIILTMIAYLPGWIFESDIWLRIQAARNSREAYKGIGISVGNALLFVGILPFLIAYFAIHVYPPVQGQFPPELGFEADSIFMRIATDFASPILLPFITLGLVAASMSTIDTCTNVVALSVGYDAVPVISKKMKKHIEDNPKWITAMAIILTILFAWNTESLWNLFYLSSGILTTTIAPLMFGLVFKQIPSRPLLVSATAGFISTFFFYYLEKWETFYSLEPTWLQRTGVGYILMAVLLEFFLFFVLLSTRAKSDSPDFSA